MQCFKKQPKRRDAWRQQRHLHPGSSESPQPLWRQASLFLFHTLAQHTREVSSSSSATSLVVLLELNLTLVAPSEPGSTESGTVALIFIVILLMAGHVTSNESGGARGADWNQLAGPRNTRRTGGFKPELELEDGLLCGSPASLSRRSARNHCPL